MSDAAQFLESTWSRLGRWAAATIVACALHLGGAALALMYWQETEDADDPLGALSVEMAPLPAAVPVDSPDVAHGPDQQLAKLTREAAKPVAEEVAKDIPSVEPSPAPKPEVALPKPQPVEKARPKQQEEAQDKAPQEKTPQQDADIPVTAAPPRVEAQPVPRSAPSPGQSASVARMQARWEKSVVRHIHRHLRYPAAAERRGVRGVVVVRFRVDRSGQVVSPEVVKSSGSPILDEEALAAFKRASPLPLPTDEISDPYLESFIPIGFGMKPKP